MGGDGREAIANLPRFHVLPEQMTGGTVTLDSEQAHKAIHVLRLREGDPVAVMDGGGDCFVCHVQWLEGGSGSLLVVQRLPLETEPPFEIAVCQAVPKGDKLETVVRACTEAGATRFTLFPSEHSVARWPADKVPQRVQRLRAIARDAAEQSMRARVPDVAYEGDLLTAVPQGFRVLFLYEGTGLPLLSRLPIEERPTALVVGPEGGFSGSELALAREQGWAAVSVGPRVLRTEHAALVGIASLLAVRDAAGQ